MKRVFGTMDDGRTVCAYKLRLGAFSAEVTDLGATLISLIVPDSKGNLADVVLGYDTPEAYLTNGGYVGATVGRNANRIKNACFVLNGKTWALEDNENGNNLHSGFSGYDRRLWDVEAHTESSITFRLESPHGDQGFPGAAVVHVTYTLEVPGTLAITYCGVSNRDTVFNMTNHTYFNLAGHEQTGKAMAQTLSMPARFFTPADDQSIPTGEKRSVAGTPMDFRLPKALGEDIGQDYEPLKLQGGYDHNFEVFCNPCAILRDPDSGRTMSVHTDCPGIQLYTANFLENVEGKGGVRYGKRTAVCLETQFFPNAINTPEWVQPVTKAGEVYTSTTRYKFS